MKKRLFGFFFTVIMILALSVPAFASTAYTVAGTQNYLAVRTQPATSSSNEIGAIHNGDVFNVDSFTNNGFAYGYTAYGQWGYVNANYLRAGYYQVQQSGSYRTVSGVNNYLGLRTTPTRNDRDEIGRLYNGQAFYVTEWRNDGFAYGHSANGQWGYVVSAYLR